jgi:sporulation protein YlmC with PRC-barrel domain
MKTLIIFLTFFLLITNTPTKAEETIDVTMSPIDDVVTLLDGSTLQLYNVNDTRWYELFRFDSIVGQHCKGNTCVFLSPNKDEINIDWEQVAVVGAIIIIRVAKPKWLPRWMTGRGSGGSTAPTAASPAGGACVPPACGGPGGVTEDRRQEGTMVATLQ